MSDYFEFKSHFYLLNDVYDHMEMNRMLFGFVFLVCLRKQGEEPVIFAQADLSR